VISIFYIAGAVAVLATVLALTRANAVHGLLYFVVSLLAVALVFFTLGATFVAALEVVVYAGAIMVLFLFTVMLLDLGPSGVDRERRWLAPKIWLGPAILAAILAAELGWIVGQGGTPVGTPVAVDPKAVGRALFGPYLLGVEIASMLLLAGLVGAFHLGQRIGRGEPTPAGLAGAEAAPWSPDAAPTAPRGGQP
jgi:NADH-quinone oxidoreductase subunit J